jgi:hypothetical protein
MEYIARSGARGTWSMSLKSVRHWASFAAHPDFFIATVKRNKPMTSDQAQMLKFAEELLRDPARLAEHNDAMEEFDKWCMNIGFIDGKPTERSEAILRAMRDLRETSPSDLNQ